jgi:hypothetical protein
MFKRGLIGCGVTVLLVGALLAGWLGVRGPEPQPRYLLIEKGMTWDRAEEILGRPPSGTFIRPDGTLQKIYVDVDGRAVVVIDGEVVTDVDYIPDNPNPGFYFRLVRWLRL